MRGPVHVRRRSYLLGVVVTLALLLLSLPASAAGAAGRWSPIDTDRYPGATCFFHTTPDDELHYMSVRAPVIYAIDSTPAIDQQTVGWRFTIQASDDSGTAWKTLLVSSVV